MIIIIIVILHILNNLKAKMQGEVILIENFYLYQEIIVVCMQQQQPVSSQLCSIPPI